MKTTATVLLLSALATPAWPATRTITLSIPTLSCAACPITVKQALSKVPGVLEVKSDLRRRETSVTFDDSRATTTALTRATGDAGFPATVLEGSAR